MCKFCENNPGDQFDELRADDGSVVEALSEMSYRQKAAFAAAYRANDEAELGRLAIHAINSYLWLLAEEPSAPSVFDHSVEGKPCWL